MVRQTFSAAVLASILAQSAVGAITGYKWEISGNTDLPTVKLRNNSNTALITAFSMTIGDTNYNFDYSRVQSAAGIASTLVSPDTINGAIRSDVDAYTFSGFDPGEVFQFQIDMDRDGVSVTTDYQKILFNNGAAPNSKLTVTFANGVELSGTLPDYAPSSSYVFQQHVGNGVIPEPTALAIWGMLGGLGLITARRRRRAP